MPVTDAELIRYATHDLPFPDAWEDGTPPTFVDRELVARARYYFRNSILNRQRNRRPQRRAYRLLRQLLTAEQRRQLSQTGRFLVATPAGNVYRLTPRRGMAEAVTRHGKRYFSLYRFCLVDAAVWGTPGDVMPWADHTVAHLLLLMTDEDKFLATANATMVRDQLWNREYLARVRRRRKFPFLPLPAPLASQAAG